MLQADTAIRVCHCQAVNGRGPSMATWEQGRFLQSRTRVSCLPRVRGCHFSARAERRLPAVSPGNSAYAEHREDACHFLFCAMLANSLLYCVRTRHRMRVENTSGKSGVSNVVRRSRSSAASDGLRQTKCRASGTAAGVRDGAIGLGAVSVQVVSIRGCGSRALVSASTRS